MTYTFSWGAFMRKARIFFFLGLALSLSIPLIAQTASADTIAVLLEAYKGETWAHEAYLAYARKALEEKYPQIAYLFTSLAASEGIHTRNFADALAALGVTAKADGPSVAVSDTRNNLINATDAELHEIDVKYPSFLKRVQAERQDGAARQITYAWLAEKQHRDIVAKLQAGSQAMFGLVVSTVEGSKATYYVCQICGSMLDALPTYICPNCGNPVSNFRVVEPLVP